MQTLDCKQMHRAQLARDWRNDAQRKQLTLQAQNPRTNRFEYFVEVAVLMPEIGIRSLTNSKIFAVNLGSYDLTIAADAKSRI